MLLWAIFVLYTALCAWVVFLGGAEAIGSCRALRWLDWLATGQAPEELRAWAALSWLAGLVLLLVDWSWRHAG